MKERLISLAWAAPWMLFMGFPLAYALELTDPAQRAGLIGLCALLAVVNWLFAFWGVGGGVGMGSGPAR